MERDSEPSPNQRKNPYENGCQTGKKLTALSQLFPTRLRRGAVVRALHSMWRLTHRRNGRARLGPSFYSKSESLNFQRCFQKIILNFRMYWNISHRHGPSEHFTYIKCAKMKRPKKSKKIQDPQKENQRFKIHKEKIKDPRSTNGNPKIQKS